MITSTSLELQKLLDGLQTLIAVLDEEGKVIFINNTAVVAGGMLASDVLGKYFWNCFWFDYDKKVSESIQKLCKLSLDGKLVVEEVKVYLAGELVWIDFNIHPVFDSQGKVIQIVPEGRIITDRKIAEKKIIQQTKELQILEERWSLALEGSSTGVWDWDLDKDTFFMSMSLKQMFGIDQNKDIYNITDLTSRIHPDYKKESRYELGRHLKNVTSHYSHELKMKSFDGGYQWFLIKGKVIVRSENQKSLRMVGTCENITDKKDAHLAILKQANYDNLTGLPNRRKLYERIEYSLTELSRGNHAFGLFILDLDKFKDVNDSLGHEYGDILLQCAAERIVGCVRQFDTVYRLGGDEFAVILTELQSNSHIEDTASKIIKVLQEPFNLNGKIVYISASLGISISPTDSTNIDTLFRHADQAMYKAKVSGRNKYSFFTLSLQEEAEKRATLIHDLRRALENNEFEVYYQPIIDFQSDIICKAEALLRWHHPTRGMVSPLEFISVAEETGLICEIGDWVLQEASKQAKIFADKYSEDFQVSVNISPRQFMTPTDTVTQEYKHFLDTHNILGKNIVMEITENVLMDVDMGVKEKLLWLKENDIEIAIDDFGTGYSSLSYLKEFKIDYLKIDKIFIDNIDNRRDDFRICEAIILMAHTLGVKVIAEGVETEVQKHILCDMGCDFGQGYFFSKPISADDFKLICD